MNKDFNLSETLKAQGSTQKDYAEWLGKTPEALCKRKGNLDVEALCALNTYIAGLNGVEMQVKKNKFVISIDLDR